jgi:hypothetical protein
MEILVLLVPVVSKSLFLFLLLTFLATVASLQSGGAWLRDNRAIRTETSAAIALLKDNMQTISIHAARAPFALITPLGDVRKEVGTLESDAEARIAARHIFENRHSPES